MGDPLPRFIARLPPRVLSAPLSPVSTEFGRPGPSLREHQAAVQVDPVRRYVREILGRVSPDLMGAGQPRRKILQGRHEQVASLLALDAYSSQPFHEALDARHVTPPGWHR